MENCIYCERGEALAQKMTRVAEFENATWYLATDQTYLGRTALVVKGHYTELDELPADLRADFFEYASFVTSCLRLTYLPNKVNYAVFGDVLSHFHLHFVPKHIGCLAWGKAFTNKPEGEVNLSAEDFALEIQKNQNTIIQLAKNAGYIAEESKEERVLYLKKA